MSRPAENRVYHQDYIARIRYSNALPPPPNPPKLLNIPGTGLADGYYTSASYASRMAREQPLNIEADAELGMPINLVGLPGVFEGDESAISGLDNPPPPHPHDKPLLRSVAALGKPMASNQGVSFLRRTEYISSDAGRTRFESTTSKDLVKPRSDARKRKRPEVERTDDPTRVRKAVLKGFDLAYPQDADTTSELATNKGLGAITPEERKLWNEPVHPTKPSLSVLDSYPLLPDPDATTDTGAYIITKFQTNPVATRTDQSYDQRLDVGILRPIDNPDEEARRAALLAAHEADPKNIPMPEKPLYEYEFFLPAGRDDSNINGAWEYIDENDVSNDHTTDASEIARRVRRRLDVHDPRRDDDDLYHAEKATASNNNNADEDNNEEAESRQRYFVYKRLRRYETYRQISTDDAPFSDVVALALHDPDPASTSPSSTKDRNPRRQKAAYFYPIMQRSNIRGKRGANAANTVSNDDEGASGGYQQIDYMDVSIRPADEFETAQRDAAREGLYFSGAAAVAGTTDVDADAEGDIDEAAQELEMERRERLVSEGNMPRGFLKSEESGRDEIVGADARKDFVTPA